MHGIGNGEARTVTESPGARTRASCPSRETPAGARERSPIYYVFSITKSKQKKKGKNSAYKMGASRFEPALFLHGWYQFKNALGGAVDMDMLTGRGKSAKKW